MSRLAALTGGTGFLGRHVAAALIARGWRVRMLTRREPDLPELAGADIETISGDLSDDAALARLVSGADAVIHLAGLVKAARRRTFFDVNAEGTAAAARAWRNEAPQARFLLISSMAAREPQLSHYAASKRAGEERLREIAKGGDWRILRPGAIYGPHDKESLEVLKLANMPVQLMLGGADARISMIDVRDCAAAIAALAEHPGQGALHELTDARRDGYSWPELSRIGAAALGRTPRAVRLPAAILRAAGAGGALRARLTGRAVMLTSAKVREILHKNWAADPALPPPPPEIWRPEIALEDGLRKMADHARRAGSL